MIAGPETFPKKRKTLLTNNGMNSNAELCSNHERIFPTAMKWKEIKLNGFYHKNVSRFSANLSFNVMKRLRRFSWFWKKNEHQRRWVCRVIVISVYFFSTNKINAWEILRDAGWIESKITNKKLKNIIEFWNTVLLSIQF